MKENCMIVFFSMFFFPHDNHVCLLMDFEVTRISKKCDSQVVKKNPSSFFLMVQRSRSGEPVSVKS